jgi:outer membrane protein assembly factor BamB
VFGNGKIFISHTHQDNALCDQLAAALDVWQVDYWMDLQQLSAGQELLPHIQQPLSERDIFIRVCTPAAQQSPWMDQERMLAQSMRAPNRSGNRFFINLVLAPGYQITGAERRDVVIDATKLPPDAWIRELREALGIPAPGRRVTRRTAIGLGATSIAALGAVGFAGKLLLTTPPIPGYRPTVHAPKTSPQASASRLLWKYALGVDSDVIQGVGLSVDETGVYGAAGGIVFSLGLTDGALRWEQFGTSLVTTSAYTFVPNQTAPAHVGDSLYLIADGNLTANNDDPLVLLALSSRDGTLEWQTVLNENPGGNESFLTAPVVPAGTNVIVQYNNTTAAFDTTTHAPLWPAADHVFHENDLLAIVPNNVLWASPAVSAGTIYAGAPDGNLYAYSLATGKLEWSFTRFSIYAPIQSTPAVVDGVVYFGRNDGYCYAVEALTGKLLWSRQLGDSIIGVSPPSVVDGVVYICAGSGASFQPAAALADYVFALDARTGKVLWQTHPSQAALGDQLQAYSIMNQPLVLDGTVYVTASIAPVQWTKRDLLYALSSTDGSLKWHYLVAGQGIGTDNNNFPSPPVAFGNVVYFASSDSTVYALSLA